MFTHGLNELLGVTFGDCLLKETAAGYMCYFVRWCGDDFAHCKSYGPCGFDINNKSIGNVLRLLAALPATDLTNISFDSIDSSYIHYSFTPIERAECRREQECVLQMLETGTSIVVIDDELTASKKTVSYVKDGIIHVGTDRYNIDSINVKLFTSMQEAETILNQLH